jgi:hypothetical protein
MKPHSHSSAPPSTVGNGPTGAGKPGTGGPGATAGTNRIQVRGIIDPRSRLAVAHRNRCRNLAQFASRLSSRARVSSHESARPIALEEGITLIFHADIGDVDCARAHAGIELLVHDRIMS